MKVYIRSSACISPQKTFEEGFLSEVASYTGTRLNAIEPEYREFIDPKLARRMSRIIKMGVAAAKKTLAGAEIEQPDAIITGTAFGCMEDTVAFMTRMVEQQEELLPPTAFIQSTHNTVAAQIALMLQCHGYNFTYVHKGISFESALQDGIMLLREGDAGNVLVGGTEEMVDTSFKVLTRLGLYKRRDILNTDLYKEQSKGTIGGEGAAFVLLSVQANPENLAELKAMRVFFKPDDVEKEIVQFLAAHGLNPEDIDLVITGRNGDMHNDEIYNRLDGSIFGSPATAAYKHLCGEYPVSVSFALWLAANILKRRVMPPAALLRDSGKAPEIILVYNHYQNKYHSLILLTSA